MRRRSAAPVRENTDQIDREDAVFAEFEGQAKVSGTGQRDGGNRRLMIAALRYSDELWKIGGEWLFAERVLYFDWVEDRPMSFQQES